MQWSELTEFIQFFKVFFMSSPDAHRFGLGSPMNNAMCNDLDNVLGFRASGRTRSGVKMFRRGNFDELDSTLENRIIYTQDIAIAKFNQPQAVELNLHAAPGLVDTRTFHAFFFLFSFALFSLRVLMVYNQLYHRFLSSHIHPRR